MSYHKLPPQRPTVKPPQVKTVKFNLDGLIKAEAKEFVSGVRRNIRERLGKKYTPQLGEAVFLAALAAGVIEEGEELIGEMRYYRPGPATDGTVSVEITE